MIYDFDHIAQREGTDCFKYDGREQVFGRGDVIPAWVADMDFPVAPFIREALAHRLENPVYGYEFRSDAFSGAVAGWVGRRNGWQIDPRWVDFTPGVVAGFALAIRALSAKGDGVVIQPPVYHPFAQVIKANGRKVIDNQLKPTPEGYRIDFEELDRKLRQARLLLFCNPHNPTGRVFTREELQQVADLCRKHNVRIISDEIHCDLIQKPHRHIHIASLSDWALENTVTLVAPSKTFNLAALSTAVSITPSASLRRKLTAAMDKLHVGLGNTFGNAALIAAYTQGDEWLDQLNAYTGKSMQWVCDFLEKQLPSVRSSVSEGTYMMWLDFTEWKLPGAQLHDHLIQKAGVGLNDGRMFGPGGEGFMRLNCASSLAVIQQIMERIAASKPR